MRVAALDYGKARIGVAVCDELGMLAHPRAPIAARDRKQAIAAIQQLQRDEGIERFLVGLPLHLGGAAGQSADEATRFAQQVSDATGCEVELVDERWSTVQASRALREGGMSSKQQRQRIDSAAAAVLLQAWLDGPGRLRR